MSRLDKKKRFIKQLADFLVNNQSGKSIMLQMEQANPRPVNFAGEWAALRNATPLNGYPTMDEAEKALEEFLL